MKLTIEVEDTILSKTERVSVTAGSIQHALRIAGRGRPGVEARVVFPIDPDSFFFGGFDTQTAAPAPEAARTKDFQKVVA